MSSNPITNTQAYLDLYIETVYSNLVVLSFGGGQDSTTILYKLVLDKEFRDRYLPEGSKLLVLMANTHEEHDETYDYLLEHIIPFCKEHNIEFVMINNDMGYHGDTWQSLTGQWKNGVPTIGSMAFQKTCTHKLKLEPQFRYVEQWIPKNYDLVVPKKNKHNYIQFAKYYGKITWMVGIAFGEEKRVAKPESIREAWRKKSIEIIYPLIDFKLDRKACQEYIKSIGKPVPLPSNCLRCCYSCNFRELLWLNTYYPEKYEEWVVMEDRKLEAHKHQYDFIIDYRPHSIKSDKNLNKKAKKKQIIIDWGNKVTIKDILGAVELAKEIANDNRFVTVRVNYYEINAVIESYVQQNNIIKSKTLNLGVHGGVHKSGPKKGEAIRLNDVLEEAKELYGSISNEELWDYKMSHGHCTTSTY